MKNYNIFYFLMLVFSGWSCQGLSSSLVELKFDERMPNLYKVTRIDSVEGYYLISLKKGGQNFKLIEPVGKNCCNSILVNEQYEFRLEEVFPLFRARPRMADSRIQYSPNGKVAISLEDSVKGIYVAPELDGLCHLTEDENSRQKDG